MSSQRARPLLPTLITAFVVLLATATCAVGLFAFWPADSNFVALCPRTQTPQPTSTLPPTITPQPSLTLAPTSTEPAPTSTPKPTATRPPWRCPDEMNGAAVVGNSDSKKFHTLRHAVTSGMATYHRVCFSKRADAVAYGYVPCKVCDP